MDEEIEKLVVRVRADTQGFARDVAQMRGTLEGPLEAGVDRAGREIEGVLQRVARTGKLSFEDLRAAALGVLDEIAKSAIHMGLEAIKGGSGGSVSSLLGLFSSALGGFPGRATGGPVSPGRPYWVGERGPELFVPASAGQVAPAAAGGAREVRVAITVNAGTGEAPRALAQSSRQVARAVKAALAGVD